MEKYEMGAIRPKPEKKKMDFTKEGYQLTQAEAEEIRKRAQNDPEKWREQE